MISLFHIENASIYTGQYSNLLHDDVVREFERMFADFVGAKYAVSFNSATSAIFLATLSKGINISIPSIIPPVVPNALITSGNTVTFTDDTDWVGWSYTLHDFGDYKIVDSAQRLEENQFKECNPQDLMIFSFYPTKPVGSCDGGMVATDDLEAAEFLREMSLNGMSFSEHNWDRKIKHVGYKMYMNSIQASIAMANLQRYALKYGVLNEIRDTYNSAFGVKNSSHHLYRINVSNRDSFIASMSSAGIQCGIHYKQCHDISAYSKFSSFCGSMDKSVAESASTVSIPFHEALSASDVKKVIDNVQRFAKDLRS